MLEIIIVLFFISLDQFTKVWASTMLPLGNSVPLISGVFQLTYVKNYGAAFGMLQNQRVFFLITTVLVFAALIVIIVRTRSQSSILMRIALALFLAGAAGNFIDRLILGYVRDFLDFRLINFAIFNIADSCVTVGAVLIGFDVLILDRARSRRNKASLAEEAAAMEPSAAGELSPPLSADGGEGRGDVSADTAPASSPDAELESDAVRGMANPE